MTNVSSTSESPSVLRWLGWVLVLTVVLYATGLAALALAIMPGYTSPLWPPAGIGLVALLVGGLRYWPALLTAFGLLVLHSPLDWNDPWVLMLLACAGGAVVLQAIVGVLLIRMLIGWPSQLVRLREVLTFLIAGGPVACTISASVSVLALTWTNTVSEPLIHWLVFWLGDTLGVLLFAPLTLVILYWNDPAWSTRRWPIAMPLVAGLALVTLVITGTMRAETQEVRRSFERQAEALADALRDSARKGVSVLTAVQSLYEVDASFTPQRFARFARRMLADEASIVALGHAWMFPPAVREHYEQGFRPLRDAASEDDDQVVRRRPYHAPVQTLLTDMHQDVADGWDLAGVPEIAWGIEAAHRGNSVAAGRVGHIELHGRRLHVLPMILPAGETDFMSPVPGAHHDDEIGIRVRSLHVVLIPIELLLELAQTKLANPASVLRVYDNARGNQDPLILQLGEPPSHPADRPNWFAQAVHTVPIADRTWTLEFGLPHAAVERAISWQLGAVLLMSVLASGLLSVVVFACSGRAMLVERLVGERTHELEQSYRRLQNEVAFRRRAEAELMSHSAALENANRAMQLYAEAARQAHEGKNHVLAEISQELRGPLIRLLESVQTTLAAAQQRADPSTGASDLTGRDDSADWDASAAQGSLPPGLLASAGGMEAVRRQAEVLLAVLDDLADVARIEPGTIQHNRIDFRLTNLLGEVLAQMRPQAEARRVTLRSEFAGPVPAVVHTDPTRLRQLLTNLLTLAIRDCEGGEVVLVLDVIEPNGEPVRLRCTATGRRPRAANGRRPEAGPGLDPGPLALTVARRLAEMLGGALTEQIREPERMVVAVTIDPGDLEGTTMITPSEA